MFELASIMHRQLPASAESSEFLQATAGAGPNALCRHCLRQPLCVGRVVAHVIVAVTGHVGRQHRLLSSSCSFPVSARCRRRRRGRGGTSSGDAGKNSHRTENP